MPGENPHLSEAMLRFLNSLPTSGHLVEWIGAFRDGLARLLSDVDRVMVDVNYLCDLDHPETYRPVKVMTQHIRKGRPEGVSIESESNVRSHAERIIAQAKKSGFDPAIYHAPVSFEYEFGEGAYLGTIVLWREKGKKAISKGTIALVEELRSFLIFVLSNLVARHNFVRPVDRAFHEALSRISIELKLTEREQEVLAVHLFGYPYQAIAEMIHVGIDTVRKHVKSIHRKAGVMTYTELFAKYFTPRLFPEGGE